MSQFAHAIRSYRSGFWTRDQLLSAVDQELTDRRTAPRALLAILDSEHAAHALPSDVHGAVTARIANWSQDDTLMLQRAPAKPAPDAEGPKTILLDRPAHEGADAPQVRSPAAAVGVGAVLQGRFKLIEHVGEGGMSRVYKAIDLRRVEARSQNPFVAVKVLTVPFNHYFDSIHALDREAHKLQSLTHPNIVRVIDVDRDGQTVFMTMEFLSGESLQRKLKPIYSKGMAREEGQRIVAAIASALEFAHRTGIVHGDLKPGNVIITDAGEVKVIDFGIARFLAKPTDDAVPTVNKDWEALNALTPPYASPEMLEDQAPDPRDDVYALACIAHEVLTGQHPFARASAVAARDAGARLARSAVMTGHQYQAIAGGLQFERRNRTASAQAFIDEFCGRRSRTRKQALVIGGAVAIVLLAMLYRNQSARDTPAPAQRAAPLTAGQVFRDCATCPLMRVLPAGKFIQGSAAEAAEQPPHQTVIATPIAFGPREVAIGEFEEFADDVKFDAHGCNVLDGEWRWRDDVDWDTLDDAHTALHPVSCVSWEDATAYAAWLSTKTGEKYRLPSASEWEYAASAGAISGTPLGADLDAACKQANVADEAAAREFPGWSVLACNDRYARSAPVGSFAANAFGLHDTIGNVFEWVQDCWSDTYDGAPTDGSARIDGDCGQREMRGGSWFTSPAFLRASYRNRFEYDYRSSSVGFRVVREIHP